MPEFTTLLADRFMVESPRWQDDRLVFSDWGSGEIVAVDLDGRAQLIASVEPGLPFSLDRLPDGRLLVLAQAGLLALEPDGTLSAYADLRGIADTPWNEIVVDGRGRAFVNNIGHKFGGDFAPGFVHLVAVDGAVRRVADDLAFPNGMAITPDGSTLIVAESYAGVLTAYDVGEDGGLSGRRVWADLNGAAPDGICLDAAGAAWFAEVPGRRCVRVAEGGQVLRTITADLGCFSCALGGPERSTLFVTAAAWPDAMDPGSRTGQILTAPVDVPGAGWPG